MLCIHTHTHKTVLCDHTCHSHYQSSSKLYINSKVSVMQWDILRSNADFADVLVRGGSSASLCCVKLLRNTKISTSWPWLVRALTGISSASMWSPNTWESSLRFSNRWIFAFNADDHLYSLQSCLISFLQLFNKTFKIRSKAELQWMSNNTFMNCLEVKAELENVHSKSSETQRAVFRKWGRKWKTSPDFQFIIKTHDNTCLGVCFHLQEWILSK